MIIVIRILLLLLPVVGLLFWIRARARKSAGGDISEDDVKHLRLGLIGLVVLLLIAGLGIRMTDTRGDGGAGAEIYVPARVENGKTIPGHFVKVAPEPTPSDEDTTETPDDSEDSDNSPS